VELVDELERLATLRRSRNPVDRRSYALELTASGEELLGRAKAVVHVATSEFLARLSEPEQSELGDLLAKLVGLADIRAGWAGGLPASG
jgi:DNA-binding MarR family transcriptional regulator